MKMDRLDAENCFEQFILTRWDEWEPNEYMKADWVKTLMRYEWDEVKYAVEEYVRQFEMYKKPKLNKICELIKAKPKAKAEKISFPEPTVFVQFIEAFKDNYYKVPGIFHGVYSRNQDPDYLLRVAEHMRQQHEDIYGGRWIVVQGANYSEMREQAAELRRQSRMILDTIKRVDDITELELQPLVELAKELNVPCDVDQWLDDDYPDNECKLAVECMLKYDKLLGKAVEDSTDDD